MKRFICAVFTCLLLALLPVGASAAEVASGTCGADLTWVLYDTGEMVLSGTGDMEDHPQTPWYSYRSQITSLRIGDGVTGIGLRAFKECTALKTLKLGNNLKYIGYDAFYGCTSLDGTLVIPDSVEILDTRAFRQCVSLDAVILGSGLTTIGYEAFMECTGLDGDLVIPNSVQSLDIRAFYQCANLDRVVFGRSVSSIRNDAFNECTGVREVEFKGRTVPVFENHFEEMFEEMMNLKTIWVPAVSLDAYTEALADLLPSGVQIKAIEGDDIDIPTGTPADLNWFFSRLEDSYLWASANYHRIMEVYQ